MTTSGTIRLAVAFFVLVILHFSLRPALGWRAEIDFLLIAVLLAAVRLRPGAASLVSFVVGLIADSLTPNAFGAGALAMTIVGYLASWLKAVFFADNLALNGFFFFAGQWAYTIIYLLAAHQMKDMELLQQIFIWGALSSAVTAAAGVVLLVLMRPLLEPATA